MSDEETKVEGEAETCSCGSGQPTKDCCGKEEGCKCEGENCTCDKKEE